MKNERQHFLAKLLVSAFLLIGFVFWTSHFVVDAANWTIGSISRNNANYLSGAFWDNNPTTGDIVKALYGNGDEGTVYTQNWSGYTSGSCLSGGMNVITTGVLPTALSANTIYVLASGTYNTSTPITMNTCSALISSGIVTLSGNVGASGMIFASEKNNFIIEKIRIENNSTDGISISSGMNFSLNEIKTSTTRQGISISNSSYGNMRNIESYSNTENGISVVNTNNINVNTLITRDNHQNGVYVMAATGNIFSGVTSYNNTSNGFVLNTADSSTINNASFYTNTQGLYIFSGRNNTLRDINSYNNVDTSLSLLSSYNNTLTNIVANNSANGMGLYLGNSSGNTFSGVTAYGNYYAGVHLYNSNNNTGINIVSNSNEGGLYAEHSTGNIFNNIAVANSTKNGVALFGSNNTILSGLISSGNMNGGIYMSNSNNNSTTNSSVYQNLSGGFLFVSGNNNIIKNSNIYSNTGGGISIIYSSNNILSGLNIYNNTTSNFIDGNGILSAYSTGTIIQNSSIKNNYKLGIDIDYGYLNLITGCSLSGNIDGGIFLNASYFTNIIGTIESSVLGFSQYSVIANGGNNNSFSSFLGNNPIIVWTISGSNGSDINNPNSYLFDSYTRLNNYIGLVSSPYTTLTGNIPTGSIFSNPFDNLITQDTIGGYNGLNVSGVNSLTVGGATWDGTMYTPIQITTGTKIAMTGETGTTNIAKLLDTIEVVSGNTYLTMNGGTGTITYSVLSGTAGQYFKILKSIDGTTWTTNALTNGCVLDENLICTFSFTGTFKLFAFGIPTNYSFTGTTQSGTIVTSGGLYNTGVRITFTGGNLSGATLNGTAYTSGTLISSDGIKTFVLMDIGGNSTGITFTIDRTNPLVTGNYPTSGLMITQGNNVTFTRTGTDTNMSGYRISIIGPESYIGAAIGTSYTQTLINGNYTYQIIAIDRAGNTGYSQVIPFSLITPLAGMATVPVLTVTGFTRATIPIQLWANKPANFTIRGGSGTITGVVINNEIHYVPLTAGDGNKTVYITFSTGTETVQTIARSIQLDTTVTTPILSNPISGGLAMGTFPLSWIAPIDSVGISGYDYYISPIATFDYLIKQGTTTGTSVSITAGTLPSVGTYYWYIKATDKLGNIGTSAIQSFIYTGFLDMVPDSFSFNTITQAIRNRVYVSNTITVAGLSANTPVLVSVTRGALYINGTMVGTTGYVQNGSTVKVELTSSTDYNTYVSSTVTIGDISAVFRVTTTTGTTATNGTNDYSDISTSLSNTEKLQIIAIFEALRDLYTGDKKQEFFSSLMVMLQSKIDDLGFSSSNNNKREALEYFYDLADQYGDIESGNTSSDIGSTSWIKNNIYTAPNGKKYTIRYDSAKKQFTSPNFITPKYFPTLDVLKYTIDLANPLGSQYANAKTIKARWGKIALDGTWQTSPYTAPNRKVFYFFKTMEGRYSSYTFSVEKYFDSLDGVKEYIYNNNKK